MAKYSTGDAGQSKDDSCQLCGTSDGPLTTAKVEGASITVCTSCEPDEMHREDKKTNTNDSSKNTDSTSTTSKKSKMGPTPGYTISRTDSEWAENTDYGNTRTPYMQDGYSTTFVKALDNAGITKEELAEETGLPIASLDSLESGDAVSDGVGRKIIEGVEEALEIELIEEV